MSLSGVGLLDDLRDHLAGDADLSGHIGARIFHGRADLEAENPFVIYRIPTFDYESALGPQETAGQTASAIVQLTSVDESSSDTALLATIASRLNDVLRTWSPAEWSVRNIQLDGERMDAFDSGGRSYQTAAATYSLMLERL